MSREAVWDDEPARGVIWDDEDAGKTTTAEGRQADKEPTALQSGVLGGLHAGSLGLMPRVLAFEDAARGIDATRSVADPQHRGHVVADDLPFVERVRKLYGPNLDFYRQGSANAQTAHPVADFVGRAIPAAVARTPGQMALGAGLTAAGSSEGDLSTGEGIGEAATDGALAGGTAFVAGKALQGLSGAAGAKSADIAQRISDQAANEHGQALAAARGAMGGPWKQVYGQIRNLRELAKQGNAAAERELDELLSKVGPLEDRYAAKAAEGVRAFEPPQMDQVPSPEEIAQRIRNEGSPAKVLAGGMAQYIRKQLTTGLLGTAAKTVKAVGSPATQESLLNLVKNNAQKLGPYAGMLLNAAAQGPEKLAVTHFLMSSRDPRYQQRMTELQKEQPSGGLSTTDAPF